jgi:uncharacterized protein YwgA
MNNIQARDYMASVSVDKLGQLPLLILYAINATDGKAVNEVHLQKIMFQTMKILKADPEDAGYRAHYYGPYSDVIKEEEKSLESLGFITEKNNRMEISESVKDEVSKIKPPSEEAGFKIKMVAEDLSKLENDELLLMIYSDDLELHDGKYLENSKVKDKIMGNRITIAIGMYRSNKVSLERAAELAGTTVRDLEDGLVERFGVVYVD